jgi:UDP-glucose 4-epimerase
MGVEVVFGRAETPGFVHDLLVGVDHLVYAAGGLLPVEAARDPTLDATRTLVPWIATLEALRDNPHIAATLVSSGGTVYGNPSRLPVAEADELAPISSYGVSRQACELYARSFSNTYGLQLQIARCANVYGPDQPHDRSQGAVAVFMHRIANGLPITIYGDGLSLRDYVHIDDVAGAISTLLCEQLRIDVVNIGSGRGHTTIEVVETLAKLIGRKPDLRFGPERPQDVRAIVLDIARLRSLIDYEPIALHEGLRRVWQDRADEASALTSSA